MSTMPPPSFKASVLDYYSPHSGHYTVRRIARTGKWQAAHRYSDLLDWDVFAEDCESADEAVALCIDDMARCDDDKGSVITDIDW